MTRPTCADSYMAFILGYMYCGLNRPYYARIRGPNTQWFYSFTNQIDDGDEHGTAYVRRKPK